MIVNKEHCNSTSRLTPKRTSHKILQNVCVCPFERKQWSQQISVKPFMFCAKFGGQKTVYCCKCIWNIGCQYACILLAASTGPISSMAQERTWLFNCSLCLLYLLFVPLPTTRAENFWRVFRTIPLLPIALSLSSDLSDAWVRSLVIKILTLLSLFECLTFSVCDFPCFWGRFPFFAKDIESRTAKRGGFKRGGFPIWICPSFFVLVCPFWDFSRFWGIFPICPGTLQGFSWLVIFLFAAYWQHLRGTGVRDTIWTFPEQSGKPPSLETPRFSFSQLRGSAERRILAFLQGCLALCQKRKHWKYPKAPPKGHPQNSLLEFYLSFLEAPGISQE